MNMNMNMTISLTHIVLETKIKIERNKKLFPDNILKLKKNFLNATGLSESVWNIIYDFPPIKDQEDFDRMLEKIKEDYKCQ